MGLALHAGGCGDDTSLLPFRGGADLRSTADAGDVVLDLSPSPDLSPPRCLVTLGPADRERKVVVSNPYDKDGMRASLFRVFTLSADGALAATDTTFALGRATSGDILFTPDGTVGLVAQEDGSIGVFRLPESGPPVVVEAAWTGAGYASRLVMDPSGDRFYVLNDQWRENGGGISAVQIACDGKLTSLGQWAPAKLPAGMAFLPPASPSGTPDSPRAVVAATDILDSRPGLSAHLLSWDKMPRLLGGEDAFGDDDAIVSATAVTLDGKYMLIADNSEFSGIPNRMSVIEIKTDGLKKSQLLSPLNDPVALGISPFGNAAVMASGYGNALFVLGYDPVAMAPFTLRGQVAYVGKKPQLPSSLVVLSRGKLKGRILLAENIGVRQLAFQPDGTVMDIGLVRSPGMELDSIVGALGVQP